MQPCAHRYTARPGSLGETSRRPQMGGHWLCGAGRFPGAVHQVLRSPRALHSWGSGSPQPVLLSRKTCARLTLFGDGLGVNILTHFNRALFPDPSFLGALAYCPHLWEHYVPADEAGASPVSLTPAALGRFVWSI